MKKAIFSLILIATSITGQAQSFFTADAQVVSSSLNAYTRMQGDTVVVDSTSASINCWFGQVGNPYVDPKSHDWCQFVQIKATLKGDARVSDFINRAWKFADEYRQAKYPDVK